MNKIEHTNITPPPIKPKEGQFYHHPEYKHTYFLARVGPSRFCLVNLRTGDRWSTDPENSEMDAFVDKFNEFVLVVNPFTITPNN